MTLKDIKNKNIKSLIKKLSKFPDFANASRDLRENMLMELRFARLIVPAYDVDGESFKIRYFKFTENYDNLHVYTDLNEFKKSNSKDFKPMGYELIDFRNEIYSSIANLIINDSYEIPMVIIWDSIARQNSNTTLLEEFSHDYTLEDTLDLIKSFSNEKLISYLNERKRIQSYDRLFYVLKKSVVFVDVEVIDQNDSVVISREVESYHRTDEDNYIVTYTDLNSFKRKYFAVVDWFELIEFVIYYQIKGIKIKTADNEIKLSRNQLLKHYDSICELNYRYNYTNSFRYLFKVEDYADVR